MKSLGKRIGGLIQDHRRKLGWTIEELSEKVETSRGYLCDIEQGKRLPSLEMLERVAHALKLTLRDLV